MTKIHDWPIGRRLTSLQLGNTTFDLALAFDVLAAAPRLEEVVLAPAYDSHAQWTARVAHSVLELAWHGGGVRAFEAIVDVIRALHVFKVAKVVMTGTRGVDPAMVQLVRSQLTRIFHGWPDVREIRLFGVDHA